jgi:hypothetical protein
MQKVTLSQWEWTEHHDMRGHQLITLSSLCNLAAVLRRRSTTAASRRLER